MDIVKAVSSLALPGSDTVLNVFEEYMKAKEMTPEQLKEVHRLRERLDKLFSDGEEKLMTAITKSERSRTMKNLTLMLTMTKFASIQQDYDELDHQQGSRLPSQKRHFKDLLTIYNRLDKLFKHILSADLEFMRGWEEKFEVDTRTIELALKNIVKDANDEFMERTVWRESDMKLQTRSKQEIEKLVAMLSKDDKKEHDQAKRCENDRVKRVAVRELINLARQSHASREYIAEQGAIELLIDLLKNGTIFVKQDVACALGNLAFGNATNCEAIVSNGGIELFNDLLDGTEAQPEYAAYALGRIAYTHNSSIKAITDQGDVIPQLVDLLRSETTLQRSMAAFALGSLTVTSTCKDACARLVGCGAVPILVGLLKNTDPFETAYSAQTLGNLVVDENQLAFDVVSAASDLVELMREKTRLQMEFAAYAVAQLAHNRLCSSMVSSMDPILPLVLLLDGSKEQIYHAAHALANLAEFNSEICRKVVEYGGIGRLSVLLYKTDDEQLFATRALGCIAPIDEAARREIVRHGVVKPLFGFLTRVNNRENLLERAAYALSNIATDLEAWGDLDTKLVIAKSIDLLEKGPDNIKAYVAAILKPLCFGNYDEQLQAAITPLAVLVKSGSDAQKNEASAVLANLAGNSLNHKALSSNGAVESLVGMLSSWSNVQIDNALLAVAKFVSIPNDEIGIMQYLASIHAVKSLKKLILDGSEHQTTEAARLMEKLLAKQNNAFYDEICINVPGTFEALCDLQTNGTDRQQKIAGRVIMSLNNIYRAKVRRIEEGPPVFLDNINDKEDEKYNKKQDEIAALNPL